MYAISTKILCTSCSSFIFIFPASAETETIRKQYSKILDAYGCLGVLSLNVGGKIASVLNLSGPFLPITRDR